MNERIENTERNLSGAEAVVMKVIWDAGEDIAVPDLMEILKTKYGKDYARTTVATFLLKISEKGFIQNYRKGKIAYVRAVKSEADYRAKSLKEEVEFWHHGNTADMVSALLRARAITEADKAQIRSILDGLDD